MFTFGLKGGFDDGVNLVNNVRLFSHLANIGDTRSLIIHPASPTHRQLSDEDRVKAGAGPEVVRLSVGLEAAEDIIADLEQALEGAGAGRSSRLKEGARHLAGAVSSAGAASKLGEASGILNSARS